MQEILNRLKEPSSMAGVAILIQMITGYAIPPELLSGTMTTIFQAISGVAALAAIFMKEGK